jgi:putative hemolysin
MVAETLTGSRAADSFPVFKALGAGVLCAAYGSYAVAANVEDGDIFELCKLPAGAVVLGGAFYSGDLDSGTEAIDIDVGWAGNGAEAADPDGFVNMGVLTGDAVVDILAAGSNYRPFPMTTGPLTFTKETVVQAEANVAAATFVAGTIYVVVYYVVP